MQHKTSKANSKRHRRAISWDPSQFWCILTWDSVLHQAIQKDVFRTLDTFLHPDERSKISDETGFLMDPTVLLLEEGNRSASQNILLFQNTEHCRGSHVTSPLSGLPKGTTSLVYSDVWRRCVYVCVEYLCSKLMAATAIGLAKLLHYSPVANQRSAANLFQELRQISETNHTPQHFREC